MSVNYQFPVGKITLERYRKERRNTQAKIRRLENQFGLDLSNEIPLPKLEEFGSRKEFNAWVRDVRGFRDRGNDNYQFEQNPYGVVATKRQLKQIESNVKEAQAKAQEEIDRLMKLPFISGGVEQATVGLQRPNQIGISVPKDFDFDRVRNNQRLKDIEEGMKNRVKPSYYDERADRMKYNFLQVLGQSFNSDADELAEKIRSLSGQDFYAMYLMFDEFDFAVFYPTDGTVGDPGEGVLEQMENYVDELLLGNIDMVLEHDNFRKTYEDRRDNEKRENYKRKHGS